ncbi:MAG: hypothetical protein AUK44_04370 [Porphyromonadaceae bacterium CG2_30_38_12]|nr:MAG: hypothetical protein AUK44_04370 [Porphyromonadaceae bacterium CG2_30_38_12]
MNELIVIWIFLLIPSIALSIFPFVNQKGRAIALYAAILLLSIFASIVAFNVLLGSDFVFSLQGNSLIGNIDLKVDALSAWFMLIINFGFLTGGFYGLFYMNEYRKQKNNLTLQAVMFILLYTSLLSLCVIQNGFVFLIAWEIMALSAFLSIIFEHEKAETIESGINFLIQSHVSILFLMLGFIWVGIQTGSYSFHAIELYSVQHQGALSLLLFLFFFVGFAIKAGFVPFHTWLPLAHPVAPSHISGLMSGILIKIGIFGILRMLLLIKVDFVVVGSIIIIISVVSGLYGVMLAILQHNLKKLLAYHSIENIGIIGIGIGIGCQGLGSNNVILVSMGFGGALLHTFNHSLFKSLLFYTAGNIYQATHNLDIEKMGGLIKKMPHTAFLFLIAALAISGLPPFNGFISEFMLYSGMFQSVHHASILSLLGIVFTITGLVLIGGLALICFTKAFGVVFLGSPRHNYEHEVKERSLYQLLPLYVLALVIIAIGLFPTIFLVFLAKPVQLFTNLQGMSFSNFDSLNLQAMQGVSKSALLILVIGSVVFGFRYIMTRHKTNKLSDTWGCGYTASSSKLQYTASSFVKSYSQLFQILFLIFKKEKPVKGIFPGTAMMETHPSDLIEKWLIDFPTLKLQSFLDRFRFFQNGNLQFYILYGIVFIIAVIAIPLIYFDIDLFITFLKQL